MALDFKPLTDDRPNEVRKTHALEAIATALTALANSLAPAEAYLRTVEKKIE